MIMRYSELSDEIPLESKFKEAIEITLEELSGKADANDRMKAINMILFNKTHTTSGAALKLHYSERSVQYWINEFVNEVGKKAGFVK